MPLNSQNPALISCVLPTYNRRAFLPHAIHYYLRQDYPNKELIIVDDGTEPADAVVPSHPSIRYVRLPRKITLGAKLNFCCEQARGPFIAQWDDDDWYAPDRLSRQLEALLRADAQVCGSSDLLYYDLTTGRGYRYVYPANQRPWLLGSSLLFRRGLWERSRFADIDVGMDGLFVWATPPEKVHALPEPRFAVHLIHQRNVSPKRPNGAWWSDYPLSGIAAAMGEDWCYYQPGSERLAAPRPRSPQVEVATDTTEPAARTEANAQTATSHRLRNVYACLVHESRDCVIDLCRNLRHLDSESTILLYNGGRDSGLLAPDPALKQAGAIIHPKPQPANWGSLHGFALDCMRFLLSDQPFDTMTIVDSDQLALRSGWPRALQACLAQNGGGVGLLGNCPERQSAQTKVAAAVTAWKEFRLWQPLLCRFPDGESKFVHWTFWPSTVFTADAAKALVQLFDHDQQLQQILKRSRLWVTEEILFPTLTALLGFRVVQSPGNYAYVRYRQAYGAGDLAAALSRSDVYWIHPVPRLSADPLRISIRAHCGLHEASQAGEPEHSASSIAPSGPQPATNHPAGLDRIRPSIVAAMRRVTGWLFDDEAELLITATGQALADCPDADAVVEVGSFRGKGTTVLASVVREVRPTARVWAVDPHDGLVGALGQGLHNEGPTLESFRRNITRAGLSTYVETVRAKSSAVNWTKPICFLLIDGLHDHASVAGDFHHFESSLADAAWVAFHDYADYFPDVRAFVDELLASGRYAVVKRASSLIVLRKSRSLASATSAAHCAG